jgi:hypothetical protein
MLAILDLGPNILGYRAEGKLESADIDRAFEVVDERLAAGGKIRVYTEVASLMGISLNALWDDFRQSIQHWNVIPRIEKVALVTDIEWLRRAAHWEDRMFRGLQIQAFTLDERDEAHAWLES